MPLFRRKPVIVEAFRLKRSEWIHDDLFYLIRDEAFRGRNVSFCFGEKEVDSNGEAEITLEIHSAEGVVMIQENDWIIRERPGKICSCKARDFERTYEPVEGE